jgi:membrane associated rhomboid family serine protease
MIPLGDVDQRLLSFPIITVLIIGINGLIFLLELIKGQAFIIRWSLIPVQIAAGQHLINILTATFMHASWLHILGNMIFLWAFGPEIEDVMGQARYLVFYLLGGLIAFLAQVVIDPTSTIPSMGASGAIAAVMGAFLVTFPRHRIRTLVILGWFVTISLIPSIILVGLWFFLQLLSEVGSLMQRHVGGVAYMAHVGGFIFGMASARFFETRHTGIQRSGVK